MNLKKMLGSMEGLKTFGKMNAISNMMLAAAVLLFSINQFSIHETTRLIPPTLTTEVKIGWSAADEEYLKSFGLYAALLMGNVTPKNVQFVADSVSAFVDPVIYPAVRQKMMVLAKDPVFVTNAGSVSFSSNGVVYEKDTSKIFVKGVMTTLSATGKPQKEPVTVEYVIKIRHGRPVITAFDTYEGNTARTLKWLQAHPPKPVETTTKEAN